MAHIPNYKTDTRNTMKIKKSQIRLALGTIHVTISFCVADQQSEQIYKQMGVFYEYLVRKLADKKH